MRATPGVISAGAIKTLAASGIKGLRDSKVLTRARREALWCVSLEAQRFQGRCRCQFRRSVFIARRQRSAPPQPGCRRPLDERRRKQQRQDKREKRGKGVRVQEGSEHANRPPDLERLGPRAGGPLPQGHSGVGSDAGGTPVSIIDAGEEVEHLGR